MKSVKEIIANNIVSLRKSHNLTQAELAAMLNYSDKAISKWERGESTPDVDSLVNLAEVFQVSVEYFFHDSDVENINQYKLDKKIKKNKIARFLLSISVVILIALSLFELAHFEDFAWKTKSWIFFIWALPICLFITQFFLNKHNQVLIIIVESMFLWSLITAIFLQLLIVGIPFWMVYLFGVPVQTIICLKPLTTKIK